MPRIPVRTTPYHTLPRCTRHYKSKRDLILRALGKASFINGSQFVIAWISPKGEVDVYASELLQAAVSVKDGGVLGRQELDREAARVRGEMNRRWEEVRRLEESGEASVMEGDQADEAADVEEDEDVDEADPDRTYVEDASSDTPARGIFDGLSGMSSLKQPSPTNMMSTFSAARSTTPLPPMHTLNLAPHAIEDYYTSRFAALQQATCKLVVKAWIKVIEPKKQMKFPYNKGEHLKPAWWPEGVRHREPDHLSKTERLTLLSSIVRSPLISVSRLELSTAEAAAFISRPRLTILREVYLVAKEEEKRREGDLSSDLIVHLPNMPVSPSAVSPDASEKRSHAQYDASDKENLSDSVYATHSQKRLKHTHRLAPLVKSTHANYDPNYGQPFTYAPQPAWRDVPPPHLSPYPHSGSEMAFGSDYSRSPNPEAERSYHTNHLAPILNHTNSHSHSPVDSPAFPQSATLQPSDSSAYYSRNGQSYMQQQQVDYLHSHGHSQNYDYGSPYLADNAWDGFPQTAQA